MRKSLFLVLFLLVSITFSFAVKDNRGTLVSSTDNEIIVKFDITSYDFERVTTHRGEEVVLKAPNASPIMRKGAPDLVKLSTSVIIPDRGKMKVRVIDSDYIELGHIKIAPSKGVISRKIDPRTVKYEYGKRYKRDQFFPGYLADMGQPYIARDFRGQAILVYPFQYNPVTNILRVYTSITLRIAKDKKGKGENEYARKGRKLFHKMNRHFKEVYARQFLNYSELEKKETVAEAQYSSLNDPIGRYLIVCYNGFMSQMNAFKTWKESIGYTVDLVDYSTIGSSSALKTYVANYYNTNGLGYLLLVGDHAQVPASSTSAGYSDNNYGYIVGSDHYLDIFVGRFSAENTSHVTTQVNRTIYYERDLSSSATWFRNATGMASNEGAGGGHDGGESDEQHMDNMLTDLDNYNYTTSTNYQDGGSVYNLTNLINAGNGVMLYTGHGSTTAWTCGWTFGVTQVNALSNTNKYPFIFSVACVVGNFTSSTCFCEAWLRATNSTGNPTGAVAHAGSTINQDWLAPMTAQDEMVDILVSGNKRTFAGVFVNGMFQMLDEHGTSGQNMADTWTCFGDPSVQLRTPGTPNGPSGGTPIAPVASFSASPTTVEQGDPVQFTDTSSNGPTTWSWSFPGGTPSTSTSQNPTVTYNSLGTYNVSLTVTNSAGTDSITQSGYITVTDQVITYCSSQGDDYSYEWIAGVEVGSLNNTSGAAGYTDFTSQTANLTAGGNVSVALTPGFAGSTYSEYWKIWIDYNQDGDFTDSGEEVFSSNGTSAVSGSFTVPSSANGITTRMRVTMKYNATPTSCETFSYGEVEDYTVTISAATVNPPVAEFTASTTSVNEGGTVTFTDQSTNNPTSWSWSFPGGTPSTSTAQNPTVTYNTAGTYNVTLTAANSAGSDSEVKSSYITVNTQTVSYCTASGSNQNYEWISGVSIGSINNSTGASGYADYTSISTTNSAGSTVSVSLTPSFSSSTYTEYWTIWVDWNGDGDFSDSGEEVFTGSGTSTVSGSFTIPTTATGSTRIRVAMKYGGAASSCGTFTYGEVEDYTINIQ
jgi:PKD repeat protein